MGLEGLQANQPGGGNRHRGLRHVGLEARQPGGVGAGLLEQQVALAHHLLEDRDAGGMLGVEGRHQAVEEAPAVGGGAGEQPVLGRGEPEQAHVLAQRARSPSAPRRRSPPGGRRRRPLRTGRSRPVPSDTGPCAASISAAIAQPPEPPWRASSSKAAPRRPRPGRQQRDGLEEVGLARPVGAGQRHEPRRRCRGAGRHSCGSPSASAGGWRGSGNRSQGRLTPAWA